MQYRFNNLSEQALDAALDAHNRVELSLASGSGKLARVKRELADEQGMSTIEYAMGSLAAAALAAVLYAVIKSGSVSEAIQGIIDQALSSIPS